jgi:hypothetical protein
MELDRFVDGVNANPHLTRLAVAASGLVLDHFVDGANANPHLTRLAVAASGLALDHFVDGVNANPHLTRLAVAASGLALDHFVDGVNANPPRKTARTRKPHDIQRPATTQPKAPFVSPPWFVTPTLYRENRASFRDRRTDNEERRASARRGSLNVIIADRASQITCRLVSQATAGLRQPLLVVRCWSLRK